MRAKVFYMCFYSGMSVFLSFSLLAQTELKLPLSEKVMPSSTVSAKIDLIPERAQQILDFWFGPLPSSEVYPTDKVTTWFAGTPELDRQIREEFSKDMQSAINGELNSWRGTPKGRLALILLLDQFPRNIYRNTPQAFISDPMAKGVVLEGIQKGDDKHLYPIEKIFFYLPLQHSEDPYMQALSVAYYKQLVDQSPDKIKPQMQESFKYALLHQQVISRFGRFPHRNIILGRQSTPEEMIYLSQRGSSVF